MIVTPSLCERIFPMGEEYPFCPKYIKETTLSKPRQSYLETKLFGCDINGEVIDSMPLTKRGNISAEQRKINSISQMFEDFCDNNGVLLDNNINTKVNILFRGNDVNGVFNVFPTPLLVNGELQISAVKVIATTNISRYERKHFIDNVDVCVSLFILNSITDGFTESVIKMSKRHMIHYAYWVFGLRKEFEQVFIKFAPTPDKISEGKEYVRKTINKLENTSNDAIPSFEACRKCKLNCDKRIIDIVR